MIQRRIRALVAASGAAVVVLLAYVMVDLYMSGHGKGWTPDRGDPWYYHLFTGLLFLVPVVVGVLAYRRD
jgi:hypothetical protein